MTNLLQIVAVVVFMIAGVVALVAFFSLGVALSSRGRGVGLGPDALQASVSIMLLSGLVYLLSEILLLLRKRQ